MSSIVIDCGTTNLRVTLLSDEGNVLCGAKREGGVRHTALDGHNGRLKQMLAEAIGQVLAESGQSTEDVGRCIAYGMITSAMGLMEIPHLIAPASAAELRAGMKRARFEEIAPFEVAFIPGVRNLPGQATADNVTGMDMMRGEETEAVGLYDLLGLTGDALLVLPGSHNKFVKMGAGGRILGCMTSISGELLDAVSHHTILADAVERGFADASAYDAEMTVAGALECRRSGLGRAAFAGRILRTLGDRGTDAIRCYLLGAVLAEDVLALEAFGAAGMPVYAAGKAPLQQALCDVIAALTGTTCVPVNAETTAKMGLHGALCIAGQ